MRFGDREILRSRRIAGAVVGSVYRGQRRSAKPNVAAGETVAIAEVVIDATQMRCLSSADWARLST
jgi:hypothetical protein